MNNKTYLLTYLITFIGGVLLVVLNSRERLFEALAIIVGIVFLVLGLVSFIGSLNLGRAARQAGAKPNPLFSIVSAGAFALGLLMVIMPDFFVKYLVYAIGVVLIFFGGMQLYNFIPGMRSYGLSGYFLSVPVLSVVAGAVIMILGPDKVLNFLALLCGIVMLVYSLNGLVGYYALNSRMKTKGKDGSEVVDII